ncbi:MAG TPA: Fic family protein [Pseudolysinimonas sp.]|nr:Fic family protein [Pseudolysinimonas sp.]
MTEYLDLEELLQLCRDLGDLLVRDIGLLHAAAERPSTSPYGRDAYPGVHDKAAALMQSLARNHALVDGDKRLSWLAVVVFYGLNDIDIDAPADDAHDLVIEVSTLVADLPDIARRLAVWCAP